jgi:hypothetical protein
VERDHRLQHLDGIIGLVQRFELLRDAEAGLDFAEDRQVDPLLTRGREQRLPGRKACRDIVVVDVLNLGNLRKKERIGRLPIVE